MERESVRFGLTRPTKRSGTRLRLTTMEGGGWTWSMVRPQGDSMESGARALSWRLSSTYLKVYMFSSLPSTMMITHSNLPFMICWVNSGHVTWQVTVMISLYINWHMSKSAMKVVALQAHRTLICLWVKCHRIIWPES